jgi:hypothetical protein
MQIAWGTGSAPAAAAAATGTLVGEPMEFYVAAGTPADLREPFSVQSLITGLQIGTKYWIDIQKEAITTAADCVVNSPVLTIVEIG